MVILDIDGVWRTEMKTQIGRGCELGTHFARYAPRHRLFIACNLHLHDRYIASQLLERRRKITILSIVNFLHKPTVLVGKDHFSATHDLGTIEFTFATGKQSS